MIALKHMSMEEKDDLSYGELLAVEGVQSSLKVSFSLKMDME